MSGSSTWYWTTQVMIAARVMTKTTAPLMPTAVSIFFDTPRKGQFPRYWISRMLLIKMALIARVK